MNNIKKIYEKPNIRFIEFGFTDIITDSYICESDCSMNNGTQGTDGLTGSFDQPPICNQNYTDNIYSVD